MGELGLPIADTWQNSASYLQSWLKAMKGDPRFIFRATAQASRAADHVLSYSRQLHPSKSKRDTGCQRVRSHFGDLFPKWR